ncbi:MAG TPA: tyrosine-type recombinase/integrase [Blastocatellia bacterium]|nr:tyrosine-type recombinase/integrase [Blastocatellia bacterium]
MNRDEDPIEGERAAAPTGQEGRDREGLALLDAVEAWAGSSIPSDGEIHRDRQNAALSFFSIFSGPGKELGEITQREVLAWVSGMRRRKLAETTIYARTSHLSSFFKWILKNRLLGLRLRSNLIEQERAPIDEESALRNAVELWARSTTRSSSPRSRDIHRDKQNAVRSFFAGAGKEPAQIVPGDVTAWVDEMKRRKLAETTIYTRISHLSSFFKWMMKDRLLGHHLRSNPVESAFPKAPKPYQTRVPKSLGAKQVESLLKTVNAKARTGDLTSLRDYALLMLFLTTGMRRSEVLGLKGRDIRLVKGKILIRSRIKGGDDSDREVDNPKAFAALRNYLQRGRRLTLLGTDEPLWIRHDREDHPPRPLSGWSFVQHLKAYAKEAGIGDLHLHQLRHTFAGMVATHSGSMSEAQEALGHRHLSTTSHYVRSLEVKKDRFSRYVIEAFELPDDDQDDEEPGQE